MVYANLYFPDPVNDRSHSKDISHPESSMVVSFIPQLADFLCLLCFLDLFNHTSIILTRLLVCLVVIDHVAH